MADDGKVIELTATEGRQREGADSGQLARGQAIGRYMVVEMVGQGGMGIVYAAYDPDLDRKVALKLLRQGGSSASRSSRTRLLREARAMAKLHHPNVVTVYEVGTAGDDDFVAMQYVDGSNLSEWLFRGTQRASQRQVLSAFQQAGRGLAAAHRAGLIHRDFKPANVLVDSDGRARVTDFGLAQLLGDDAAAAAADASDAPLDELTRTGATMGTPAYMAPEQYLAEETDARTDQFSFCVALYEALYGERPFGGRNIDELRDAVVSGRVRPDDGSDVPGWIRKILLRGLSVDPDERYPDMGALLADLARDPAAARKRWMMAIGFLIVVGAIVAMVLQDREAEAPGVCADARGELAGVWDDGIKAKVHQQFDRARIVDDVAERAYQGFSGALDDYADDWVAMHTAACQARFVAKSESQEEHLLRMTCLQNKRDELAALAEVFTRADEAAVEQASQAARGLSSLDECADIDALRAGIKPPSQDQRDAVAEVRAALSEVKALDEAAKKGVALERVKQAVRTAREIGYKPVLAEALYLSGRVSTGLGHSTEAREAYDEAIIVAEEAGHDRIRAEAMLGMTSVTVAFSSRIEDARLWGRRAAAAINNLDGDHPLMEGRLNELLASTLIQEQKLDEALALLEQTRALYRGLDEPEKMARVHDRKGEVLMRQYKFSDALEEYRDALVLFENNLGRDHPRTVLAMEGFAAALRANGNYDTSREYFARAEKFWESDRGREFIADRRTSDFVVGVRTIRGRVTDSAGRPVAKAEVVVGQHVAGDGKYLWASDGGLLDARWGRKHVFTDADGLFEIEDVGGEDMVIAAEHWEAGRAAARLLPDGDADRTVGLVMRPVGSLRGRVTVDGAPMPGVIVVLQGIRTARMMRAGLAVVADERGGYELEAVSPGNWKMLVVRGFDNEDQEIMHSRGVTIEPERATEENIAIARGQIRLDVRVKGRSGTRIESSQVVLVPGIVKADTGAKLSKKIISSFPSGRFKTLFVAHGQTASFEGVKPGLYSVCAVPLAGDYRDPEFIEELTPHILQLDTHCEPLDILPKPERQTYTAVVPPMSPLPK